MRLFAPLLLLLAAITAAAQSQPAPGQPAADALVLRDGTSLVLRSTAPLSSATSHVGDIASFQIAKPVKLGGLIVIARGATVTARVTSVQPARRKGRGGHLELAFDHVQLVTGATASIRATVSETAGGQREMVANMVGAGLYSAGLAAPLFLFQRGHDAEIRAGEQYSAEIKGDLSLPLADVASHQPAPPPANNKVSVIYVIKRPFPGEVTSVGGGEVATRFLIGEQEYHLSPDSALCIEVPPGKYVLYPYSIHKLRKDQLVSIDAKAGESSCFRFALGKGFYLLESVPLDAAQDLVDEVKVYVELPIDKVTTNQIHRMQTAPNAK